MGVLRWLRPRGLSKLLEAARPAPVKVYDDFVESAVGERLRRERASQANPEHVKTREDMFHFLCSAKNPEQPNLPAFSDLDIVGETRLLLVAGSDSTSVTMSGLFYYLSHYPKVLAKLRNEIITTFENTHDIVTGQALQSCKYTRACIDEAMRMCPAGTSELPREVLAGGMYIDSAYYPEGTVVGTARWADGFNQELYGDADIFRPERWIVGNGNTQDNVTHIRTAFQPFSVGPFNCAGTKFALQELMLMVAKTVHRLEFRIAPGSTLGEGGGTVPQFQLKDAYISIKDGPMMQFRKRVEVE
jgi:cytochrome P450